MQSAWPTYTFPAESNANDDGLQLYPLPKLPMQVEVVVESRDHVAAAPVLFCENQ